MPEEKVISRYEKALNLVKDVVAVCDICHIYDNSEAVPFRIFKKRKNVYYYQECRDWLREDIELLTGIKDMEQNNLNSEDI